MAVVPRGGATVAQCRRTSGGTRRIMARVPVDGRGRSTRDTYIPFLRPQVYPGLYYRFGSATFRMSASTHGPPIYPFFSIADGPLLLTPSTPKVGDNGFVTHLPADLFFIALYLNDRTIVQSKPGALDTAVMGIRWSHLNNGLPSPTDDISRRQTSLIPQQNPPPNGTLHLRYGQTSCGPLWIRWESPALAIRRYLPPWIFRISPHWGTARYSTASSSLLRRLSTYHDFEVEDGPGASSTFHGPSSAIARLPPLPGTFVWPNWTSPHQFPPL